MRPFGTSCLLQYGRGIEIEPVCETERCRARNLHGLRGARHPHHSKNNLTPQHGVTVSPRCGTLKTKHKTKQNKTQNTKYGDRLPRRHRPRADRAHAMLVCCARWAKFSPSVRKRHLHRIPAPNVGNHSRLVQCTTNRALEAHSRGTRCTPELNSGRSKQYQNPQISTLSVPVKATAQLRVQSSM